MSDANFINVYNEVILENLNAIMKQNFMFQTQIKFLEQRVNELPEMEKKLADFEKNKSIEFEQLQNSAGNFEKKLFETTNDFEKKIADKQNDYNRLMDQKNSLAGEVLSLKNEVENKDNIIKNTNNSDADKHRLQTALNEQAKELERLSNKFADVENDIADKNHYIKQLEDMLPNSKRKKLGLEIIESAKEEVEEVKSTEKVFSKNNNVVLKVESAGGTF